MFILGTEGGELEAALGEGLGGVIFFTHDIQEAEQFKKLIGKIKSQSKFPPFLSIDQEGGRVERTENIHGGKKYLSAKFAYEKGEDFLRQQTKEIAQELKSYGINLNFAPCVDVNTNPNNPIIGERAFSDNPDEVSRAGELVAQVYREHGIIPCLKHFPGHGDANADSHLTLPVIDKTLEEMQPHIEPFRKIIKAELSLRHVEASEQKAKAERACLMRAQPNHLNTVANCENLEILRDAQNDENNHSISQPFNFSTMVMIAHLHCTCFEKEAIPTSLSKNAINYLRNELGFEGVIISDDMVMKGVSEFNPSPEFLGSHELAKEFIPLPQGARGAYAAIRAGVNMLIYRNSSPETIEIIEAIAQKAETDIELQEAIKKSYARIMELKNSSSF